MGPSIMEQVKAAKAAVPEISVDDAAALLGASGVLFVDVRDGAQTLNVWNRSRRTPSAMSVSMAVVIVLSEHAGQA